MVEQQEAMVEVEAALLKFVKLLRDVYCGRAPR
jgi:hypothetical protein